MRIYNIENNMRDNFSIRIIFQKLNLKDTKLNSLLEDI